VEKGRKGHDKVLGGKRDQTQKRGKFRKNNKIGFQNCLHKGQKGRPMSKRINQDTLTIIQTGLGKTVLR